MLHCLVLEKTFLKINPTKSNKSGLVRKTIYGKSGEIPEKNNHC